MKKNIEEKIGDVGVYIILNLINNKVYVGSSIKIEARWRGHYRDLSKNRHHSQKLQRAWNKYGEENFKFIIIANVTRYNLLETEQVFINAYNSFEKGYNATKDARAPMLGRTVSEDTKRRISESLSGKKRGELSKETKIKIGLASKGKRLGIFVSQETRERLSIAHRGLISGHKGKKHSEEQKLKWSVMRKGAEIPQERRERISKTLKETLAKKRLESIEKPGGNVKVVFEDPVRDD